MLLDYRADPAMQNRDGKSAIVLDAHRGRARALELFKNHMGSINLTGVDALIAVCALDDRHSMQLALAADPQSPVLEQLWESTWHDEYDLYDRVVQATQPHLTRI